MTAPVRQTRPKLPTPPEGTADLHRWIVDQAAIVRSERQAASAILRAQYQTSLPARDRTYARRLSDGRVVNGGKG